MRNIHFLDRFKLDHEKENYKEVISNIASDASFRGTNLWVLMFAIFIASLGLNMNAPAVIIGAMLISPLMGPILAIGVGASINDSILLKKAMFSYGFAAIVGLSVSFLYFSISPIDDAHSEILSRTQPTIYDVLIAFFGGLAGIVAICSKKKGNVIPGVAIATALMPPLCTAGYSLATWQLPYFLGAMYLYLINSVFIAFAAYLVSYLLKFPRKIIADPTLEKRVKTLIWFVIIATLLPSLYMGFKIVQEKKMLDNCKKFIANETQLPNEYLLEKTIDVKNNTIKLIFGGDELTEDDISLLKSKLKYYGLESCKLEIKQGFSSIDNAGKDLKLNNILQMLDDNNQVQLQFQQKLDSLLKKPADYRQVYDELKIHFPEIQDGVIENVQYFQSDSSTQETMLVLVTSKSIISKNNVSKMEAWLKLRLGRDAIKLVISPHK